MTREQMEAGKSAANEIYSIFKNHEAGKCTYDRALEDISVKMIEWCNKRPIMGYLTSGSIYSILSQIKQTSKRNEKESYNFDCKVHQNEMSSIDRILKDL